MAAAQPFCVGALCRIPGRSISAERTPVRTCVRFYIVEDQPHAFANRSLFNARADEPDAVSDPGLERVFSGTLSGSGVGAIDRRVLALRVPSEDSRLPAVGDEPSDL